MRAYARVLLLRVCIACCLLAVVPAPVAYSPGPTEPIVLVASSAQRTLGPQLASESAVQRTVPSARQLALRAARTIVRLDSLGPLLRRWSERVQRAGVEQLYLCFCALLR
jgi:hypothetical protein